MDEVFALLDDRDASARRPTSRLYTGFVREHRCSDPSTLERLWQRVQADQRAGLHAVLLADYEWGARLIGAGVRERDGEASLRVLMFAQIERLARAQVDAWLAARADGQGPCGTLDLRASVTREEFSAAIARIHAAIADGETYQVNYTYRLDGRSYGEPLALYRALRARQPVAYGACLALPDGRRVLSLSPELFVRKDGAVVTARPMKGTAARITAPEGDSETARLLGLDIKNRAENLMIVDLLRNDLGRIAVTGSVKVPELFAIEPYATVFQMTSTVQATLRPEVDLPALLRAVFPCGSITGAPKHHTMGLIAQLESTPRGLYCGAIGWLDAPPPGQRLGDFCLSVAIRTLVLGVPQADGTRPLRLGIGAGIVQDSVAADEYEECRLKARFLTGLDPGFELFETVLARADGSLPHLARHLARLQRSAAALGFAFDAAAARAALQDGAVQGRGTPQRLRLALAKNGRLDLTRAPLAPLPEGEVGLLVATQPLPDANPLAAHKTTLRRHYDEAVRAAEAAGAFDSLFLGADGRLVEGGRSSVFLQLDGRWWTPPVADGALPGVMRGVLLDDPAWGAAERRLTRADLMRADAIVVCNALRGALRARLLQPVHAPS